MNVGRYVTRATYIERNVLVWRMVPLQPNDEALRKMSKRTAEEKDGEKTGKAAKKTKLC